ncbi:hypothetical protein GOE05_30775, partial [Sinorhizobium medicae]|nr:hypothetical protein [Sinorhizobium medicae]
MQNVGSCADRVRIVWWDGSGVCLYSKTLEEQSFCWPGHIGRQDTSGPFAINGASGRSGLEE